VVGKCERYCSSSEEKLRRSENLLHFYEKDGPLVAEFQRSAADKKQQKPDELRTYAAMRKTLDHLINR
jgi:thiamine kinase-like enzyme